MLRDDDRSPGTLLPTYLRQVNSRQDPITHPRTEVKSEQPTGETRA